MKFYFPCLLFSLLVSTASLSQQFSFQLNFVDAAGNKDSIVIGYDASATDSLDAAFGEMNIISTPWDSVFDVRLSNEWTQRHVSQSPTFHTKKQIGFRGNCNEYIEALEIDVLAKNWPVTAYWDSIPFLDTCNMQSYLKCTNWYWPSDVWSWCKSDIYETWLSGVGTVTFNSNAGESGFSDHLWEPPWHNYSFLNDSLDTVSVFWIQFSDPRILSVEELNTLDNFTVSPNPVQDYLTINTADHLHSNLERIEIFDLLGKKIKSLPYQNSINMNDLNPGYYFIKITESDLDVGSTRQFIKQ